jgi:hypothetical protein
MIILQKNFLLQDALNTIQENARSTRHLLQSHIAHSANQGCAKIPGNHLIGNANGFTITGSDTVSADLLQDMHDKKSLTITTNLPFQPGDLALIADCAHAEIFAIKTAKITAAWQHVETTNPLTNAYSHAASVSRFVNTTFYIANTGRIDKSGQPINALYSKNNRGRPHELVADIVKWQLSYDCRVTNQIVTLAGEQVHDWSQLVGLHITLLFSHFPITKTWNMYFAI